MPQFLPQILTHKPSSPALTPRGLVLRGLAVVVAAGGVLPLAGHPANALAQQPIDVLVHLALALGGFCVALVIWRRVREEAPPRAESAVDLSMTPAPDTPRGQLALWLAGGAALALLAAGFWAEWQGAPL